ncbi:hypothetical protein PG987_008833 [Apiospora arundinis]
MDPPKNGFRHLNGGSFMIPDINSSAVAPPAFTCSHDIAQAVGLTCHEARQCTLERFPQSLRVFQKSWAPDMNVPAKGGWGHGGTAPAEPLPQSALPPAHRHSAGLGCRKVGQHPHPQTLFPPSLPPVLDGYNCPTGPDGFPDFRGALSSFRHVAFDSQCWNRIFDGCPGLNQLPEVTRFQTGQRGAVNFEPFCTILEAAYHVYFLDLCGLLGGAAARLFRPRGQAAVLGKAGAAGLRGAHHLGVPPGPPRERRETGRRI